jgi:hypothetical protein
MSCNPPSIPSSTVSAAKGHSPISPKHPAEVGRPRGIPIEKLGWTKEMVAEARRRLASVQDDWDDPVMDVYDEEP